MPITEEMLTRARQHKRAESEQLLAQTYAPVYRIAHALLGRADLAGPAVGRVMRRALAHVEKWRDDADAQRWFLHHTILEVRRASPPEPPPPVQDLLVTISADTGAANVPYAAFVRAIRGLPPQQREAVVLHHAAHLNERYMALAMDCSTSAAQAHLKAANDALATVAGAELDDRLLELSAAYRAVGPEPEAVATVVRRVVLRDLRGRRIGKWSRMLVGVAALAAVAGGVWYWGLRG